MITNGFDPTYLRAASKEALELDFDAQTGLMDMYTTINKHVRTPSQRNPYGNLIRVTAWRINRIKAEMFRRGY